MGRVRETPELAAAAVRMVRAVSSRDGGDTAVLPLLVTIAAEVDRELHRAVHLAREQHGYSWADVGEALGITRQGAQQRFSRPLPG